MKVLWLCNMMLPQFSAQLHREASNKEGWLSGLCDALVARDSMDLQLAVAFPVEQELAGCRGQLENGISYYGFFEDTTHPELYGEELESQLRAIVDAYQPDVIHCFGAEFPHTLAMCKIAPVKERVLIGIQGICFALAQAYFAALPDKVIRRRTFRDRVKKDSLLQQQAKFAQRGLYEKEAIRLCPNIAGRTKWDRETTESIRRNRAYYVLNETLRAPFYEEAWDAKACKKHRIFFSQGDYPLKGLHFAILALARLQKIYPDLELVVAGNPIIRPNTLQGNLKISSYGKYIRDLIKDNHLEQKVTFLGSLSCLEMRNQMLQSQLFLCASALENSSNSLGEAMLLGMPCVAANVGGIPSIFEGGVDGIAYQGYTSKSSLEDQVDALVMALKQILEDETMAVKYGENARAHAKKTHDGQANVEALLQVYTELSKKG